MKVKTQTYVKNNNLKLNNQQRMSKKKKETHQIKPEMNHHRNHIINTKKLAEKPGLNKDNVNKQATAKAILGLLTLVANMKPQESHLTKDDSVKSPPARSLLVETGLQTIAPNSGIDRGFNSDKVSYNDHTKAIIFPTLITANEAKIKKNKSSERRYLQQKNPIKCNRAITLSNKKAMNLDSRGKKNSDVHLKTEQRQNTMSSKIHTLVRRNLEGGESQNMKMTSISEHPLMVNINSSQIVTESHAPISSTPLPTAESFYIPRTEQEKKYWQSELSFLGDSNFPINFLEEHKVLDSLTENAQKLSKRKNGI